MGKLQQFQKVKVLYARGSCPEVLASDKLVIGNDSSEGSQTANSGTDVQELHEANWIGVSKHIIVTP